MASDLPTTYLDYAAAFKFVSQRAAEDLKWAIANVRPVTEGPWGAIPATKVFYIGINETGERIELPQISDSWRYKPSGVQLPGPSALLPVNIKQTEPGIVRIELGASMPGILTARPKGSRPIQATGLIDGQDFYFRESDGFWSLSVGGADVVDQPDWYYMEEHHTPDELSEETVYSLIAKGAALLRSGSPTMAVEQ